MKNTIVINPDTLDTLNKLGCNEIYVDKIVKWFYDNFKYKVNYLKFQIQNEYSNKIIKFESKEILQVKNTVVDELIRFRSINTLMMYNPVGQQHKIGAYASVWMPSTNFITETKTKCNCCKEKNNYFINIGGFYMDEILCYSCWISYEEAKHQKSIYEDKQKDPKQFKYDYYPEGFSKGMFEWRELIGEEKFNQLINKTNGK